MRPVRLEITGFTCYREKQEIDFSRLHLFAIAGPTGSGKSSILDAIAFALYGCIPRMGSQNLSEFISLGAARASVTLDFDMQGHSYRVVRTMPRSGTKKAQLDRLLGGATQSMAGNVTEVDERLRGLLGLRYEAFIQSVLLPQGQFALFLKSKPAVRQEIVRDLLRLNVYEEMQKTATQREKTLSAALATLNSQMNEHYADATPENLAASEQHLIQLEARRTELSTDVAKHRTEFETMKSLWTLTNERAVKLADQHRLQQQRQEIDQIRARLDQHSRAQRIIPLIEGRTAKENALSGANNEYEECLAKVRRAQEALDSAAGMLTQATDAAAEIPSLQKRKEQLAGIMPVIIERDGWQKRLDASIKSIVRTNEQQVEEEEKRVKAKRLLSETNEKIDSVVIQRTTLEYDKVAHTILKTTERPAWDLEQQRRELAKAVLDRVAAVTKQRECELALAIAQELLTTKDLEASEAIAAFTASEVALVKLRNSNMAIALRTHLHVGDQCPVCDQRVPRTPEIRSTEDLDRAQLALESAKNAKIRREQDLSKALIAFEKAKSKVADVRLFVTESDQFITKLEARVTMDEESLRTLISPVAGEATNQTEVLIEVLTLEFLAKFNDLADQVEQLDGDVLRFTASRDNAKSDLEHIAAELDRLRLDHDRLTAEKKEAEDRLKDYNDRITLVGSTDPDAERKQIDKRIRSLEDGRNDAAVESKRAEKTAAECTLKLATAKTVLDGAKDQVADAISMVDSALIREGFPSIEDAISAVMKAADVESGAESIRTFDTRCIELSARLLELDGQLMGVFLDENDVLRADRELQERAKNLDNLKTEASVLEDRVKTLRANTARAEALRAQLAKDSAEHAIFKELALDLKSDRFQRYLFDGAFRKLVVGASTRLRQFSDRYELSYSGGQFGVIDNDHGGQTRMADTLSGGETFLASLALALELSDQIQESAGAVRLDSLFIDEGFGTLDPETLETVAEAIETLGRTNRLVGVITHVPELHRRLPRLEVKPSPLGSSVVFCED